MTYDDQRDPYLFFADGTGLVGVNCSLDRRRLFVVSSRHRGDRGEQFYLHIGHDNRFYRYPIREMRSQPGLLVFETFARRFSTVEVSTKPDYRTSVGLYGGLAREWLEWCDVSTLFMHISRFNWMTIYEDLVLLDRLAVDRLAETATSVARDQLRGQPAVTASEPAVLKALIQLVGPIRRLVETVTVPPEVTHGRQAEADPLLVPRHIVHNLAAVQALETQMVPTIGYRDDVLTQAIQLERLLDTVRRLCDLTGDERG